MVKLKTTIEIDKETRNKLQQIKLNKQLKNLNEVIKHLLK